MFLFHEAFLQFGGVFWRREGALVCSGVPFSISQSGEDAVPPDTAERRYSLPLQACPDRLTLMATPARPGCGTGTPYSTSTYFDSKTINSFMLNTKNKTTKNKYYYKNNMTL